MADSPILGSAFDAAAFRENIANTMLMGLPVDTALRPIFHFRPTATYPDGTKLDSGGKPIDPRIAPTLSVATPVQVPVAVEYANHDMDNNEGLGGTMWSDYAVLTVLDTHYTLIEAAIEVELSGRRYLIQKMKAMALGPVTVYQLQCFLKGTSNE